MTLDSDLPSSEKLLVLGAGPTGLAVAKAFREAGLPYVQVEATDTVGGNWAHGVYETAHIISSRKTTEYPDWPMPADWPDFPSAAQMRLYFADYATTFDLWSSIRFRTEVVHVSPMRDGNRDGGWSVAFGDGTRETFKGVVVCNGHHWAKSFPEWVKGFTGQVIHSKDYKRPADLAGKRVLVLGGGNSGCDLVSEAARVGACAHWSLRRGYWFMPKTFFGVPAVEFMKPWMPVAAQRLLIKGLLRVVVGKYEDYGLPAPDHAIFEAHPTISTEVFHYIKHGRIQTFPDVVGVKGDEVAFADGRKERYDVIVCATGFDVAFPFLDEEVVPIVGKTPQLVAGMLRPAHRHLYVVGAFQARYGIGPLLRPIGVLLADWVRLQDELAVPLGRVLEAMGQRPPTSHLVDPHEALRKLWLGRKMIPVVRLFARRRGWLRNDRDWTAARGRERAGSAPASAA
jgi:hypothetical protein